MMKHGHILVMDDEAKWREELSNLLRRSDYAVDTAATKADALEQVQKNLYHALILDIRMVDPDESNAEGMDFLAELERLNLLDAVEIIMLSAYGTKEQMRQAFRHYRVADFQTKEDFSGRAFVESMHQLFDEKVQWNKNLIIHWQGVDGPGEVVVNVDIGKMRVKRDTNVQEQVAFELDDLLRRLFYKAENVIVAPMVPGHSGASVLKVEPFYPTGKGEPVVVKFGSFRVIEQEYHNYKKYVEPFIGGGRHTSVMERRRTPILGGIVYSLLGAGNVQTQTLQEFYQRASVDEIRDVLNQLFFETCANWYTNRGHLHPYDLTDDYQGLLGFTTKNLKDARKRLTSVAGTERLCFSQTKNDRSFPNPILAIEGPHFVRPAYISITHGDLNDTNVLVDSEGHTWLIDFFRTGQGHILRDIAELDSVIRLQALGPDEATLAERLAMEETLAECSRFSQVERLPFNFPTENQALAKVFAICVHLRTIAQKIMAQNGNDDIAEYHIALMYFALNTIRFYSLPKIQREHALLSASVLAEHLGLGAAHG